MIFALACGFSNSFSQPKKEWAELGFEPRTSYKFRKPKARLANVSIITSKDKLSYILPLNYSAFFGNFVTALIHSNILEISTHIRSDFSTKIFDTNGRPLYKSE